MKINSVDLLDWMDEQEDKLYAYDHYCKKKFMVSSFDNHYKVFHGKEIVYEGNSMMTAINKFNAIESVPVDVPKLDN